MPLTHRKLDADVTALARQTHKTLTPEKREYLNQRGVTDASIRQFCLGELTDPFEGVPDYLAGSITIPYILQRTKPLKVRTVRFRTFREELPKYVTLEGHGVHLYNLQPVIIKFGDPVIHCCEGEFDSILLNQLGYPTVSVPGASSFSGNWKYLFAQHYSVVLVFDGDEAGRKGSNRVKSILGTVNQNVRQVFLPNGMDVTDVYCSPGGRNTLRSLLE